MELDAERHEDARAKLQGALEAARTLVKGANALRAYAETLPVSVAEPLGVAMGALSRVVDHLTREINRPPEGLLLGAGDERATNYHGMLPGEWDGLSEEQRQLLRDNTPGTPI